MTSNSVSNYRYRVTLRVQRSRFRPPAKIRDEFAPDSPLEESGFELAVPPRREWLQERAPGNHRRLELSFKASLLVPASRVRGEERPLARAGPAVRTAASAAGNALARFNGGGLECRRVGECRKLRFASVYRIGSEPT